MNKKRYLWLFVGVVILLAALVSGFIYIQPSAEDILVQTLESMKTVDDAHAVVEIHVDSVEKDGSGTVEIWGRKGEDGPGAFRVEVLESSDDDAEGAVVVSDGETLYAYSPSKAKVFVGTPDEAKSWFEEKEFDQRDFDKDDLDHADGEHPENAEEAVQKLLEYFDAEKLGAEGIATGAADHLKLNPIPDQMPQEYIAVGGFLNLWVDKELGLPVVIEYSGGSMGEASAVVLDLEVNTGLDEALFTFEIPDGVEVLGFDDLEPKSLSLDEAEAAVDGGFLIPSETPQGATLVDLLEIKGAIVQRYALPDGGSFTVVQGVSEDGPKPSTEGQSIEVRGVDATLFVSDDSDQVLLTWSEGEISYYIAGDISTEQALMIAESLE